MGDSGNASSEDKQQCKEVVIDIKEDKRRCKELIIDIDENLEPASNCCIYKVPKKLRKINEDAYTPQLISIGPFHHGRDELADMQKQKRRYHNKFRQRVGEEKYKKVEEFFEDEKNEIRIRNCYAEECRVLCRDHFRKMIMYDAVFIVELFLRNHHQDSSDFLLNKRWLKKAIKLDLQLLENQLPYFVLEGLYNITEERPSFLELSCKFFKYEVPDGPDAEGKLKGKKINHFVDLSRCTMVLGLQIKVTEEPSSKKEENQSSKKKIEDIPSAVKLNESGVQFLRKDSKCVLDVSFEKRKRSCIPCFSGDKLQIPPIPIKDSTECLIRNLMALEQCHYPTETHICNYVDLMDHLINTSKDVDLLVEKGIISNRVGDHKSIKEIFNKLCLQISLSHSCYKETCKRLKDHHDKWWNRTKATLISVYFSNLWRGTGTVAATILLLLTLLQTLHRFYPELFGDEKS